MSDNDRPTAPVPDAGGPNNADPTTAAKRGHTTLKIAAGVAAAALLVGVGGLVLTSRQDGASVARQASALTPE
ncbi:MAG: hypothetical protein WCP28_22545, partial [Actinomycetes bacterium]